MAKARRMVNDNSSAVLDELRRQFNNLLVIIEGATDLAGIQAAVAAGTDAVTGKELNGVKPVPTPPRGVREPDSARVDMDSSSDF